MIGDVAGTVPTIVNADSADYADYAVKSVCITLSSVSVILSEAKDLLWVGREAAPAIAGTRSLRSG